MRVRLIRSHRAVKAATLACRRHARRRYDIERDWIPIRFRRRNKLVIGFTLGGVSGPQEVECAIIQEDSDSLRNSQVLSQPERLGLLHPSRHLMECGIG